MQKGLACLVALSVLAAPSYGRQDDETQLPVTIDAKDQDVRETLRTLFTATKKSFVLDTGVQGKVNASLQAVPFQTALQAVLQQVNATYRLESGVYRIVPRVQPLDPNQAFSATGVRIVDVEVTEALKRLPGVDVIEVAPGISGQVTVVGPLDDQATLNEIARQVDARVVKTDTGYRLEPRNSLRKRLPVVRHVDGDLRTIVTELLNETGVNYVVSTGIAGRTTVNIVDTDVQSALEAILLPIGGRITLRRGVFIVSTR